MGKRKNYESPYIRRSQIETESGFCAASIIEDKDKQGIEVESQEVGTDVTIGDSWGDEWTTE